jgi:transposase
MFVKKKKRGDKTYISLVESFRDNGQTKQRTISSLGCVEDFSPGQLYALAERLKALDTNKKKADRPGLHMDVSSMTELARLNWGAPKIVQKLWDMFDLDSMMRRCSKDSRIKFDISEAVKSIVINRFTKPSSKLQVFEQQKNYAGSKHMDLQCFYRCLDFLSDHKDDLEKMIFFKNRHLFNMKIDVVFFDVTTLYFESSNVNALREFGYSKDCKFNEVQVVVGLLIDCEGRPVGLDVHPGNTFEGKTLEKALEKLKKRFEIRRIVVVADRGINSKLNLKAIKDCGYDYIVGSRLRKMPKPIRLQALDLDSYKILSEVCLDEDSKGQKTDVIKMKVIDYLNTITTKTYADGAESKPKIKKETQQEKIILTWSSKRARKDEKDRQRLVHKAIAIVNNPSLMKESRGAKKYIQQNTKEKITLRDDKIAEDAKWDGFYGIQTSSLTMTSEEIIAAYKNLWRIEESFRVLKFSLRVRPIFHWNPKRIKGHLMSCFLAFLLERTLELELKKNNVAYSVDKIRKAINSLELTHLSCQGEEFYLKSPSQGLAKDILRVLEIKTPGHLCRKNEFEI